METDVLDSSHVDKIRSITLKNVSEYDPDELYLNFRHLRDAAANNFQQFEEPGLLNSLLMSTVQLLNRLFTSNNDKFFPAMGQALQFIHNLTVQNLDNQKKVWNECKNNFREWLQLENEKIRNYICGTLYMIIRTNRGILGEIVRDTILVNCIFQSALKDTDFSILLSEKIQENLLDDSETFINNYLGYNSTCHVEMLSTLYECVQTKDTSSKLVEWVKGRFMDKVDHLKITSQTTPKELEEVFWLMKILVTFSSKDEMNNSLQGDERLIDSVKDFLEKLHNEGKNSVNIFTPTENIMTERSSTENIKANLIRLIGNLCWREKTVQDRLREVGAIPLILDCCIRDGKNPFITESVVFAVRNLCEGNFENQNFIKNMNEITHKEMSQSAQDWPSVFYPPI